MLTFAVVLSLGATPTFAQVPTQAELEAAGFTEAEIALFMSLTGGTTTTTSSTNRGCDVDYLRDLSMGATGADVMNLQEFLNDAGFTVSVSGAGSVGMETMYFGPATKAAVTSFQNANAATILTPIGLTMGTGYFGAGTRSAVRMQCANTTTPTTPGEPTEPGETDGLSGGEASLEDFEMDKGSDRDVEEGQSGEVAEITFDVEDGDARVSRLDLTFTTAAAGSEEDEPWDTFDTITLLDEDGDEIASEDVSDEDDWLDEDSPFVFRFSGLDYVVREGDTATIVVAVELQGSIDSASTTIPWTVYVDTDDVRAIDSEGINQYVGDSAQTVTFDVVEEGADDALTLKTSTDDPEPATIEVDSNDESDEYAIFIFDAEVEEDSSDLEVDKVYASVTVTNPTGGDASITANDVISRVYLEIDGEKVEGDAVSTGTADTQLNHVIADTESNAVRFEFDFDKDLTLDGSDDDDTEYEAVLSVEFEAQDSAYDLETTVQGSVTSTDVAAWQVEGNDDVTVAGTPTGEVHTLALYGVDASFSSEAFREVGNDSDVGEFTLKFTVKAVGEDLYIDKTTGTAATNGIQYSISTDAAAAAESVSASTTSTADTVGGEWFIAEDDTETFTLKVTVNNNGTTVTDSSGYFQIILEAVQVDDASDDSGEYDVDVSDLNIETDEYLVTDDTEA